MEIFGLLAAVLSVVVSAVATFANNTSNQQNAQSMLNQQQNFTSEQAEIANERYLNNWAATQSPQSQVKNFKDAGLSVGLMYGGANAGGGLSSAPMAASPSQQAPVMNPILGNGLNDIFDNLLKISQKGNIEEDTEKKSKEIEEIDSRIDVNNETINKLTSDTNLNNVKTLNEALDGQLKQFEIDYTRATQDDRIKLVGEMLEKLRNENEKILKEIEEKKIDIDNKQELYNAQIQKYKAETAKLLKEKVLMEAEIELTNAKKWLTENEAKLSYVERQKKWTEISHIESQISVASANVAKLLSDVELNNVKEISELIGQVTAITGTIGKLQTKKK